MLGNVVSSSLRNNRCSINKVPLPHPAVTLEVMRRKDRSRTRAFISCDVEAGRSLQLAVPTLPSWPPAHLTSSCYCPASAKQRQQKSCRCPHHISSSTPFYPTQVPCDHGFRSMPANFHSDTTMSMHKILPGDQICNHCK